MRRCLLLTLVLTSVVRAEIVCEQPVAKLGTVKAGAPLSHRFALVNKGDATVELVGFKTTCACFRPDLPKRLLGPGESVELQLHGNTLAQSPGPASWRFALAYREDGKDREIAFEILARVEVEVAVVPPVLTLTTASTLTHELTLRDRRANPLALTGIETTASGLKASFGQPRPAPEGGWARTITVEVTPEYPVGRRDELVVLHSRDPDYPELRIPVTVSKRARTALAVSPPEVTLTLVPGEPLPATRVQVGSEVNPVEIDRVESQHPAISATFAAGTLRVRVDAVRVPSDGLDSSLRVHLRNNLEAVVIPVRITK